MIGTDEIKVGDRVRIISGAWLADHGDIIQVVNQDQYTSTLDGNVGIETIHRCAEHFELVLSEFNLKTMPWFIRTTSDEESIAAQEWLFEQGVDWLFSYDGVSLIDKRAYTNTTTNGFVSNSIMWVDGNVHKSCQEIKLTYKKVVDKVELPEVELPEVPPEADEDKQIRQLKETIESAQRQILAIEQSRKSL